MLKRFALVSLMTINICHAGIITSYQDAVRAVKFGKRLTFVANLERCEVKNPNKLWNGHGMLLSFNPTTVVTSAAKGIIKARGTVFSPDTGIAPGAGPVNMAFSFKLNDQGVVNIKNQLFDPVTYEEKSKAMEADCELGRGVEVFAA